MCSFLANFIFWIAMMTEAMCRKSAFLMRMRIFLAVDLVFMYIMLKRASHFFRFLKPSAAFFSSSVIGLSSFFSFIRLFFSACDRSGSAFSPDRTGMNSFSTFRSILLRFFSTSFSTCSNFAPLFLDSTSFSW